MVFLEGRSLLETIPSVPFGKAGCGFVHIDLKHWPPLEKQPSDVFVAIERVLCFVHIEVMDNRNTERTCNNALKMVVIILNESFLPHLNQKIAQSKARNDVCLRS